MITDRQENPCTGATPEAIVLYDTAVTRFNLYRGDPLEALDEAIALAPQFVMAHLAKAYMLALATEPAATAEGRAIMDTARAFPSDERESSHRVALDALFANDWDAAALLLDRHSMSWPRDMVALQSGHLMDFYRANARDLRDRIARALPHWSADVPGQSIVLGMLAFGLEECGDYARAEEAGRAAIDGNPLDAWAHHAVAHVMEMQGRSEDGIGWMTTREQQWSGEDNFFKVHNWWHTALFYLDLGQSERALALYDERVRGEPSPVALDLVDASALLWRLHLAGVDVGDRWREVSVAWEDHADGRSYPFNDWHAVMAHLGAGREEAVEQVRAKMVRAAAGDDGIATWVRSNGLPLVDGFTAFWRGDYAACAVGLHAARFIVNRFGGSHAQRDIIDWTLTEAALRGGLTDIARAMAHERLAAKPHSSVNQGFLARTRGAEVDGDA